MSKTKKRFITILASLAVLLLALGVALGVLMPSVTAGAATTYSPSSIFWARDGGEVRAYAENAEAENGYVTFVFAEGTATEGTVEYHRDVALKWYNPVDEKALAAEGSTLTRTGELGRFKMVFSFVGVNFESYTLTFQSSEENVSKDAQAVNELVFKNGTDGVYVYIKDASLQNDDNKDYDPAPDSGEVLKVDTSADITFTLTEDESCEPGEFLVKINDQTVGTEHTKFTNIGGYFLEYRTSGTANMPIAFKAVMPEGSEAVQKVVMKEFNGQTFEVSGEKSSTAEDDGTYAYSNPRVTDNASPALVISEKIYPFTLGQRFSLSYEAIDVCDDTVVVTRYYYMAKQTDGAYPLPDFTSDTKDYKTLYTSTYFMPPQEGLEEEKEYVSIRFTLNDGRDGYGDRYYYLSWYAADGAVETLADADGNGLDYILVDREREAPEYTVLTATEATKTNEQSADYDEVVDKYQTELKAAAEKVSAGDGAYFYLPSLRNLIESKYADYRNLRFTVSYYKPGLAEGSTASNETSLRYNNLRFEVEAPGTYKFRIFAADAAGNTMKLWTNEPNAEDRQLVTLSTSNIWDFENVPEFSVYIDYTGAVIEDPGTQTTGNRGTSYSISDFDIVAYGDCTREYTLWRLDTSKLPKDVNPTYQQLVDETEFYFTTYHDCFVKINKFNDEISEDDEEWSRTDNAYHWNPGTTPGSFTPQEKGFYVVELLLTDPYLANKTQSAYQVIEIQNPRDVTSRQIDWFQNNVTSVVLFAISAVLAVAIVVLVLVKPAEKSVEDVDLDKLKGKKGKKE